MRRQRFGLVQTPDQLRFAYLAIAEGIERISKPSDVVPSPKVDDAVSAHREETTPQTNTEEAVAEKLENNEESSTVAEAAASEPTPVEETNGETEVVAQPPCKRHAEDEPAAGDQPPPKRSLNSAGQAESRATDAARNISVDHLLGPAEASPAVSDPTQSRYVLFSASDCCVVFLELQTNSPFLGSFGPDTPPHPLHKHADSRKAVANFSCSAGQTAPR